MSVEGTGVKRLTRAVSRRGTPTKRGRTDAVIDFSGLLSESVGNSFFREATVRGASYSIGDDVEVQSRVQKTTATGFASTHWVAKIVSLWRDAEGHEFFECKWYYSLTDVRSKSLSVESSREIFETNHIDENDLSMIVSRARVLSMKEWMEASPAVQETCYLCRFHYDTVTLIVRPRFLTANAENKALSAENCLLYSQKDVMDTLTHFHTPLLSAAEDKEPLPSSAVVSYLHALESLQLSTMPSCLPCREEEKAFIYSFVESAIRDGGFGCSLYVSGLPGTGKTAVVRESVRELRALRNKESLPDFRYIEVNGMRLPSALQIYSAIWSALMGQQVSSHAALNKLDRFFRSTDSDKSCTVLLVDELDYIQTSDQSVLTNLFEWPTLRQSHLIVIGVANTMDLPERLLPKIYSRLGMSRMVFKPYTRDQIETIVRNRIENLGVFEPDAIEMCARKVASVSGDIRRALNICKRAVEIWQEQGIQQSGQKISIDLVNQSYKELGQNVHFQILQGASICEKGVLVSFVLQQKMVGSDHIAETDLFHRFNTWMETSGKGAFSFYEFSKVCEKLSRMHLLLLENRDSSLKGSSVRLNIPVPDLEFALSDLL